jgi:mannosyl-3-phosphoglycerate phosphatase
MISCGHQRRDTLQHAMITRMKKSSRIAVFSDLDGTLLEHESYSWQAAKPALDRLAELRIPVVLTSSKTEPEIREIQQDMGLAGLPAIVENGAGTVPGTAVGTAASARPSARASAANDLSNDLPQAVLSVSEYADLRTRLNRVSAPLRQRFSGFGDLDDAAVAGITGLSLTAARLAQQRNFTEPGLFSGSDEQLVAFLEELGKLGVSARQGGRFLTLSFGSTKGDAMRGVMQELNCNFAIALGDAPNDVEMLELADIGIVIANPHREQLPVLKGETEGRVLRSLDAGPAGWNHAMLQQIEMLDL